MPPNIPSFPRILRFGLGLAVALVLVAAAPPARAQVQTSGPEVFPGKSEVSVHIGGAFGATAYTPGGFKFAANYALRLKDPVWLEFGFNSIFGFGGAACFPKPDGKWDCGYGSNGYTFEPLIGVKLKFPVRQVPIVPYAKIDGTFVAILNRYCGDTGFGFGVRGGGGAKYFLTRNIGVGAELTVLMGPALYTGCDSNGFVSADHTEFMFSFDFSVGAEFIF